MNLLNFTDDDLRIMASDNPDPRKLSDKALMALSNQKPEQSIQQQTPRLKAEAVFNAVENFSPTAATALAGGVGVLNAVAAEKWLPAVSGISEQQFQAYQQEAQKRSPVTNIVGNVAPAAVAAVAAPNTLLAQGSVGGAFGALSEPQNPVAGAVTGAAVGAIVPGLSMMASNMLKVPAAISGDDFLAKGYQAGLTKAQKPVENLLPPAEKLGLNLLGNLAIDPSGMVTAGQFALASPKISSNIGYGAGRAVDTLSSMSNRMLSIAENQKIYRGVRRVSGYPQRGAQLGTGADVLSVVGSGAYKAPTMIYQGSQAQELE
jgi:hypothetical protein